MKIKRGTIINSTLQARVVRRAKPASAWPEKKRISPNLQGSAAFGLLTRKEQEHIAACILDASKVHRCSINEIEWQVVDNDVYCRRRPKGIVLPSARLGGVILG